ncbi:MAG: type I pullulanase [Ruminococcus sp.]|nr:type I pullulanase [Ruminococcus sp.]
MRLRKTLSFLLALVIMTGAASSAAIDAFAAQAREAVGAYNNQNYLETQASAAYSEQNLGCKYSPQSTTFKIWSPDATAVMVKLYRTGSDSEEGAEVIGEYPMKKNSTTGVWSYSLSGDYKNLYYTYLVTCNGLKKETQDVYSKAVGVNGERSMIVDLDSTNPDGWDSDKHVVFRNAGEAVVWETHVRDFSISETSGVSDDNKGKYLAFTEGGTTCGGEGVTPTCIDYLVEQGINCVQLMPVFDFGGIDESSSAANRSDGYAPVNFNVPEGSYSTNPYDGNVRIKEFKQMVQALHDRGISVVMNVAYGYTASTDSCFTKTAPKYYYRMSSATAYSNGSGCGNETASDKKMFRKYMIESCKYWMLEYHIDGFCFDQMGLHDVTAMNEIRRALDESYEDSSGNKILMYGEPWTGGDTANSDPIYSRQGTGISRLNARVGAFGDQYRSAIIGDAYDNSKGFVQGNTSSTSANIVNGVKGNVYSTTSPKGPAQPILYADSHDGLIMWDKIVKSNGLSDYSGTNAALCKQMKEIYTLLLTSQGIPFMAAGSEFGRTKQGVGISLDSSDAVNAIDWSRAAQMSELANYYKGMLAIRRNFTPLHSSSIVTPSFQSSIGDVVAYTYSNNKSGEWGMLAVIVNGGKQSSTVTLPTSGWTIVALNDISAGLTSLGTVSGNTYNIPAKGCAVLVDSKSFNNLRVKEEFGNLTVKHTDNEGGVLKTQNIKYRKGSTYRTAPDADLLYDYELIETKGETVGTVDANGSYSVEYIYKSKETPSGYVNVTCTDEDGNSLITAQRTRLRPGESYSTYPLAIPGYELDTSKMPANAVGVFSETVDIEYVYKQISASQTTVHYKNVKNLSNLRCYAYYTDRAGKIIEPNGSRDKAMLMTNDSTMGSDWLISTVRVPFVYVIFHNNSDQDPEKTGYPCSDEVWIENGVSSFSTKIITSHIDLKTGRKIADDVVINTEKVRSIDTYTTSPLEGRTDYITPANAVGNYSVGTTNVVYYYTEGNNGDPTEPETTEPETTEPETTEPATTEPATTEPATTEPVIAPTEPTAATTESLTTDISIDVKTAKNKTIQKTYKAGRDFVIKYSNLGKVKPKYKTSRKNCVSVTKKGRITCRKKGKATVTVTLNKVKIKYKITVTSNPTIKVAGKKYSAKKVYVLTKRKTLKIKISGKAKSIKNSYSAINKKVAKVISKKTAKTVKVKALKKGKATITVKVNGVKTFKIKVKVI